MSSNSPPRIPAAATASGPGAGEEPPGSLRAPGTGPGASSCPSSGAGTGLRPGCRTASRPEPGTDRRHAGRASPGRAPVPVPVPGSTPTPTRTSAPTPSPAPDPHRQPPRGRGLADGPAWKRHRTGRARGLAHRPVRKLQRSRSARSRSAWRRGCGRRRHRHRNGDAEVLRQSPEPRVVALAHRAELPASVAPVVLAEDERRLGGGVVDLVKSESLPGRGVRRPQRQAGHPPERAVAADGDDHDAPDVRSDPLGVEVQPVRGPVVHGAGPFEDQVPDGPAGGVQEQRGGLHLRHPVAGRPPDDLDPPRLPGDEQVLPLDDLRHRVMLARRSAQVHGRARRNGTMSRHHARPPRRPPCSPRRRGDHHDRHQDLATV